LSGVDAWPKLDFMAGVDTPTAPPPALRLNVADRLTEIALAQPQRIAVACPRRWSANYANARRTHLGDVYATTTFEELDADATRIARGFANWGVAPGTRLALLVRPGIEFVTLVFALLRAGMVIVLIDPGLGRRNLIRCLEEVKPEGFVAVPLAHVARHLLRRRFPYARWNITVGRRLFWSGLTLDELRKLGAAGSASAGSHVAPVEPAAPISPPTLHAALPLTKAHDPAAIIFTSGSTGPPKGVLYTHQMFATQVAEIQRTYGIQSGGVDLACFPLFALFNFAMGVTTVFPEMDFSRPGAADPHKLLSAANDWHATQAFASPAVWRVVSEHCAKTGERIPSLQQVFSCGAPVPADVLRSTLACIAAGATMHTPYGATECLPVATIEAGEVLAETAPRAAAGAGVCVGRKFDSLEWRIIRICDEPIAIIDDAEPMPPREIGELIVRGPQASPQYITRPEANSTAKISHSRAGSSATPAWHRMGDVGYFDEQDRFWYCGRKSHRVETAAGTLFTECVEAVFNTHPAVRRSALVCIGPRGEQTPVLVVERARNFFSQDVKSDLARFAQAHDQTRPIQHILQHPSLPVDIRHNAKINREQLAAWAAKKLAPLAFQAPAPTS
jgi:olefin beta-lactone synthetase